MMSCKRKRKRALCKFVNDSSDAGLSFPAADELYSDGSGINLPHKKCKMNENSTFYQNDNDISNRTYTDQVMMFGNRDSSECCSNEIQQADCTELACVSDEQHVALAVDEQQSSNFEELLFGLISENECSQVVSQKHNTTGVVESTREQVNKADICNSVNDSSSDSDSVISQVGDSNQYCVEGNNLHVGGTSCFSSTDVLNNFSNPSAADLSQSTKKKSQKPEKCTSTPDCGKLCNMSECHEKKSKQKRRHMLASMSLSETFPDNRNQCSLLRKLHRTMSMHKKMSKEATADVLVVDRGLELNFSSIENMSSGESGYCDMSESSKKHKKQRKNKKVSEDCAQFDSSQSLHHRKKRHHEHMLSPVNNVFSSSHWSLASHKEHSTIDRERTVVKNDSIQIAADLNHIDHGGEPDAEDGYCTSQASHCKQNALKKQVTLTEYCTESKDSQSLRYKKKKKKKHHVHDEVSPAAELHRMAVDKSSVPYAIDVSVPMSNDCLEQNIIHTEHVPSGDNGYIDSAESEKQQNNRKEHKTIIEVENQTTINSEHCTKLNSSESTPYKTKSKKKAGSECMSSSVCSNSSSVVACSPMLHGISDKQKTAVTKSSTQTDGVLFHDSLVHCVDNSEDVLLEKDLPNECSTVLCENMSVNKKSEEDEFEQLLLNVLVGEKNSSEEFTLSSKESECEHAKLFDSSSDDDFYDVDTCPITKWCTSANTQLTSSQTVSAGYKLGLCTTELKDNKKTGHMKCASQTQKSQEYHTCSSDGSPSLLNSTSLLRFHCDMQIPDHLEEVSDIDSSAPKLVDPTVSVTPDKAVRYYLFKILQQSVKHFITTSLSLHLCAATVGCSLIFNISTLFCLQSISPPRMCC